MIARIYGKIFCHYENTIILDVHGVCYEITAPKSVVDRLVDVKDPEGFVQLITYHYIQMDPSRGMPILIGFLNEIEKDFFQQFIKVSGIGPRAAVKALDKPISEIVRAIDNNDLGFLKTLPGIGLQRAKEIVAKLQGKLGKFGLIRDQRPDAQHVKEAKTEDFQQEVLSVLLQLQYKKQEALEMIAKALDRSEHIQTTEDLLNEIYKQRRRDG